MVLAGGIGVVVVGILRNEPLRAAGGACLTITALTLVGLTVAKGWITDTSAERERMRNELDAERERLRTDERAAMNDRVKYLAAQAAIGVERDRMRRDRADEVAQLAAQLAAERAKMRDQFEEERNQVVQDATEAAWTIWKQCGGLPLPTPGHDRAVIQFPMAAPHPHPETGVRARGRDAHHPS